jgi:serine/threonine protein kinase
VPTYEPQFHGTPRFRIVSRIGVGAVGELYRAMDELRGTLVALRTLRNVPKTAAAAIERDFRALKAVRHPALVSLGELHSVEGLWFYTMEFVEGESLVDYVHPLASEISIRSPALRTQGPLSEVRLRSALHQLVRGVAALHHQGRVHGSIEPDHIRVTPQGRLVLLECELLGSAGGRDTEQRLFNALPFVAPERLEDAPVSPATDWYSVGAVLFHTLANAFPFATSGADLVEQKQRVVPKLPNLGSYPEALVRLCGNLLAIDPDARPDYNEICSTLGMPAEAEPRISQTFSLLGDAPPFVGRRRELGLLSEAFERTRHGAVSTLCLYGEQGIGKRTLATQLSRKLRNEYPQLIHLTGRCDAEGPRALRGVAAVLEGLNRYLASQDESSVATLLPTAAEFIPRAFPGLSALPIPRQERQLPEDQPALRRAGLRALRALVRNLSKRHPLLVMIDDVQWIDSDALNILESIIRPPAAPDMLLLLLLHQEPAQASQALKAWLARHEQLVTSMPLRELSEPAAYELVERLLESGGVTSDSTAQHIASMGAGQPLRIDALVRHYLLTSVPPPDDMSLTDLIWARVEHLPLDARQLLITLCYARVPLPAELLARATNLSTESVLRYASVLRVSNLARSLREGDIERFTPSHPAVRNAVLLRARVDRGRIHRQIALSLASAPSFPEDVLAGHFRDAGDFKRAAEASAKAADAARDSLAFDAAVALYREALSFAEIEPEAKRRLRTELAHAYAAAGQSEQAARAYVDAARYEAPATALELERRAAHQLLRTGHMQEGLKTIESVLSRLGVRLPSSPLAALRSLVLRRAQLAVRGTWFRERDQSQIPPNDLLRADILGSLAPALAIIDSVRGADARTRHLLLALKLGDPVRIARAIAIEADYQASIAEPESRDWLRLVERAENLATRVRDAHALGLSLAVRARAAFFCGQLRENVRLSNEAERSLALNASYVDWDIGRVRVLRSMARFLLGELRASAQNVEEQIREAHERGDRYTETQLALATGYLPLILADEPYAALNLLNEALSDFGRASFQAPQFLHLLGVVQCELYADREHPYTRIMAVWPALARSQYLRAPFIANVARHLRARAALAQARRERGDRELLLREASETAGRLVAARLPAFVGQGHAVRAAVHALRADRTRAVQRLEQAEAAFYEAEFAAHAAATRYEIGRLQGGSRGGELTARAEEWFESQGVKKPHALVRMLLPGFEE